MVNIIWGIFIVIGIIYSLITGNIDLINKEILESGNSAINLIISPL